MESAVLFMYQQVDDELMRAFAQILIMDKSTEIFRFQQTAE